MSRLIQPNKEILSQAYLDGHNITYRWNVRDDDCTWDLLIDENRFNGKTYVDCISKAYEHYGWDVE